MQAFKNDNLKDKTCGNCDCTDFAPGVSFDYDSGAKTIDFDDTSSYGTGGLKVIHLAVYDRNGNKVVDTIDTEGGSATISTATLDPSGGYSITATVVGDNGCISDGHAEAVGISITEGALGYWDKDNDAQTIGSESGS